MKVHSSVGLQVEMAKSDLHFCQIVVNTSLDDVSGIVFDVSHH